MNYGEYCPVAKAAALFAERWTPLIVLRLAWGVHRFNELERSLPRISRPLLVARLRRLERSRIIERRTVRGGIEYRLTPAGEELREVLRALGRWGAKWAMGEPQESELDPVALLWAMRGRIDRSQVPPRRVVVRFDFRDARRPAWLVIDGDDVSVCVDDPCYDIDLEVGGDLATFYRVWQRRTSLADSLRAGTITIDGQPALVKAFPQWLLYSQFAEIY